MEKIFFIIKKIVISISLIYSFNLMISKMNLIVPINYITVGGTAILGMPFMLMTILLKIIL